MRRLRNMDLLLLVGLTGLWALAFVLHLGQVVRGGLAWIPVYVDGAAAPDALPTVDSLWPGSETRAQGMLPGDEIVSVGADDLRGAQPLGFVTAVYANAADGRVPLVLRRAGVELPATLELVPIPYPWRKSIVAASFALLGALALWRARGSRAGRAFYLAMTAYAFHWTDFFAGPAAVAQAGIASFAVATSLFMPLALRVALLFPAEAASRSRYARRWPWLFALNGPIVTCWAFGLPFGFAHAGIAALAVQVAFITVFVTRLTRSYRICGALGRRQLRWVLIGFWVGLVPASLAGLVAMAAPSLWWLYEASLGLAVVIPLCLFIALARFNLLDVDRLITSAAISPVAGVALITFAFFVVPTASAATEPWVDPKVSQPALSLALAGAAFLGLRRVDRVLQDRLYPERGRLALEAQRLRRELSECETPADVLTLLGRQLGAILQLATAAIYGRGHGAFSPVYAHGPAVSPSFALDGPLARALAERAAPIEPLRAARGEDRAERAALAAMGVELALPLVLREELAAFACLGGKHSGDVFTSTDRALLQGLADKAADELLRFDRETIERASRELMERLRSYVPGAIAREIDSGAELATGERELTVLFVDIRGYTAFAEGQTPEAIFEAVSGYTKLVSQIVTDCGGAVVEFNGDGLMTVFGAPRALVDKERAAVRAARAIALEVPTLNVTDSRGRPHRFHVGIGVASGPGYVGNVRAVDRSIWVALGNTTNLAARLERMTRDLGAAIVIDDATHDAAGDVCADFTLREAQVVRGRSEPVDVYSWSPHDDPKPEEEAT